MASSSAASPEGKRKIADELLPVIQAFPNQVMQGHYLAQLSHAVGLDERFLYEALKRLPPNAGLDRSPQPQTQAPAAENLKNRWTDIEEFLIAFLAKHPKHAHAFRERLDENLFNAQHTRSLFPYVQQMVVAEPGADAALKIIPSDLQGHLDQLFLKADRYTESLETFNVESEIASFIHELSVRKLRHRLRELSMVLKQANLDTRQAILEEFGRLSLELQKQEKRDIMQPRI